MRTKQFFTTVAFAAACLTAFGQGRAFVDAGLPPSSVELRPHEPPATDTPWQLPKLGDPLYDAAKEAEISANPKSHLVHVFERGVFTGYSTISAAPPPISDAKQVAPEFKPNRKLPPDAVELAATEHPDASDYFQTRPKDRVANIPANFILVRVFQGKKFVGWLYLPREAVAALHKPKPR